ncbi:hypothetical protein JCM19233_1917 [Vibrio astriarenae]|nr:hypothetical protein JCM19233_1917 [Vibrio sp. C7]
MGIQSSFFPVMKQIIINRETIHIDQANANVDASLIAPLIFINSL